MTRDEVKVELAGLTHDHLMVHMRDVSTNNGANAISLNSYQPKQDHISKTFASSTIAILRRHPMYDSLVLVKRYRICLKGYSLEFPSSETDNTQNEGHECRTKLVSLYLDGDDPIYQCQQGNKNNLFSPEDEIVYVPMNGLLDRLDTFQRHGIAIDSRVYAFAMGLKMSEKFLRTSSMKEIQETPQL